MTHALHTGSLFLINTLFNIFIFLFMIRLVLVWAGANYFDPVTQFVTKLTDFVVKPLRRILPNVRRFEIASIVILLVLEVVKYFLTTFLMFGIPDIVGIIIIAFADTGKGILQIFFYAIIIQALLSWIQPYATVNQLLYQITSPIMAPLRRIIPTLNGIDITPIPALILLQLLMLVVAEPLMILGFSIAAGR